MKKIYKIDNEQISFVKKVGYALIGNHDHPGAASTYPEYFLIQDDLIDIILATDHNTNIALNINPKDVLLPSINNIIKYSSSKLSKRYESVAPRHQLQRKQEKTVNDQ